MPVRIFINKIPTKESRGAAKQSANYWRSVKTKGHNNNTKYRVSAKTVQFFENNLSMHPSIFPYRIKLWKKKTETT